MRPRSIERGSDVPLRPGRVVLRTASMSPRSIERGSYDRSEQPAAWKEQLQLGRAPIDAEVWMKEPDRERINCFNEARARLNAEEARSSS